VVHVDGNPLTPAESAAGRTPGSRWSVDEQRREGPVRVVRVPFPAHTSRSAAIDLHRAALVEHAADLLDHAAVVSAHVGGPTAAAVAPLLPPTTRFAITEHATYVRGLFADTAAAVPYREAVARAAAVLAVSESTAHTLRSLCPEEADRIHAVPNPLDVDALPLRQAPSHRRDRWLFVGNLVERKGVRQLLAAFLEELRDSEDDRPGLHLTLVGDGPLRAELEDLVARSAPDRVTFAGGVPPAEVAPYYGDHDVLVHLAQHETFGITLVEAAASGLPVVVTRCGGPEETMVVPEGFGLCRFVPQHPTTGDVRQAVHDLRTDTSLEDLRLVREALRQFYGAERAADLQARYVLGAEPARPLAAPVDLAVVAVFQGLAGWGQLHHGLRRCADLGARVAAVDLEGRVATAPIGVHLVAPGDPDTDNLLRRVERTAVDRLPRAVLGRAARVLPRLPARVARPGLRGVTAAERLHRKVSRASESRLYGKVWPLVRGQVLARRVENEPEIEELGRPDVIVHQGRQTELPYRLATRHPDAVVHQGGFTGADVARWWLRVQGPGGTRAEGPATAERAR
jgi:glycosyltransferase involved in cell wall biosynthesis